MSNLHVKYLLVGGGVASSAAAAAIRKLDTNGDLLLVGQEINRPYHRPPLSRDFLLGQFKRETLFTAASEWFAENRVQLRTGRRVSHLDVPRNCATLDSGEEISFDRLLIATGGGAKALDMPGSTLPNLFHLRTLGDADRLQHAVEKARAEGHKFDFGQHRGRGRVTVIGAGLLGLEIAGTLAGAGMGIDLVMAGERPWERVAGETVGKFLIRFLESRGVRVHRGPAIRLEGDGRVQRVALAGGETIDCDFAVAAVGLEVNKQILRGTPVSAEKAILIDARCRTSVPVIYAAGDCAAIFDPLFGKHRMVHHWDGAAETGWIAGTNMAGGDASFETVSEFASRIGELTIQVWGAAKSVDRRIIRGTPTMEKPAFVEIGVGIDDRVAQVIAIGNLLEGKRWAELVRRRLAVNGNQEWLKDPGVALEQILNA